MRLRVNGANVWSRGANLIPMEEMEGRSTAEAHAQLVRSAVDAGMNTLRIWGGGVWQYDAFYDTCDELGVLLYHDAMYAQVRGRPALSWPAHPRRACLSARTAASMGYA